MDDSDITFTEDSISVNFAGITDVPDERYLILDINFAGDGGFIPGDGSESFAQTNGAFVDDLLDSISG